MAKQNNPTANKKATGTSFITKDGTEKKQGDKVVKQAFGVTIVTNY